MLQIWSLAYSQQEDANKALGMLVKGDDFHWVQADSSGRVPKDTKGLLDFGDDLVPFSDLGPDVQNALSGAEQGDARFYHQPEGQFYVLYISKEVPPKPQPFDQVQYNLKQIVFRQDFNNAVESWVAKLKQSYEVKIYDKSLELKQPGDGKKS